MVTAEIQIMNSGTFYLFIKDITHHARNQHFNTVHYLLQINKKQLLLPRPTEERPILITPTKILKIKAGNLNFITSNKTQEAIIKMTNSPLTLHSW